MLAASSFVVAVRHRDQWRMCPLVAARYAEDGKHAAISFAELTMSALLAAC